MNLGLYPTLTKSYILERITQEQIMEKYLDIPVVIGVNICSPLRIDNNPTCQFYYNQHGRLRLRDFNGHFWGDCFDAVAYKLGVNVSNKKSFQLIIHTIAKDFKIHKYKDDTEVNNYDKITKAFFNKKKVRPKAEFKIIPRQFNYHDDGYWNKFNVYRNLLTIGKVYAAQEIAIRKDGDFFTTIYRYSLKDPAYCYYGGKDENGIGQWKIYYPFRKKGEQRFHSNSSFLQGKHLITCGRVGIITKAYKDVLAFRSFGFQAVAPSAEGVLLTKDQYWFMKTKFDYLISCMDYDRTGIIMAKKLRNIYRIEPIMFTNGLHKSKNYGSKDFAEYADKQGIDNTRQLLNSIYNRYTDDFSKLDKYYYKSLNFIKNDISPS